MDNIIVLPNHFEGKDTIIYNGWVMNGCQFFHMDNARVTLKIYDVPEEVWQQVLDAKPNGVTTSGSLAMFAFKYCRDVSNDSDMRQVIIDSGNATIAYLYCQGVSNDADMRQVIIDDGNSDLAFLHCRFTSDDADMRAIAEVE